MSKYYVSSDELQDVVMADSPICAAGKAVIRFMGNSVKNDVGEVKLGEILRVSERGFGMRDGDILVNTDETLKRLGFVTDNE